LRAHAGSQRQQQQFRVELAPLRGFPGDAGDEAVHASGHRADQASNLGPLGLDPKIRQALALELSAK
jgi:hypothetical protein